MSNDNSINTFKSYNQSIGMMTSILEHPVLEQQFITPENPGEAISSIKALKKAIIEGQKIYEFTLSNINELDNVHFHPETMNDISNAVKAGYTVITHTDNINIQGWSGAGYIIQNPNSGDGSYKISGGSNGGWLLILLFIVLVALFVYVIAGIGLLLLAGTSIQLILGAIITGFFYSDSLIGMFNRLEDIWNDCSTFTAIPLSMIIIIAGLMGLASTNIQSLIIFLFPDLEIEEGYQC